MRLYFEYNGIQLWNGDARRLDVFDDECAGLVITCPPWWDSGDYDHPDQIGFGQSYDIYLNDLETVWKDCYRCLKPGRAMVVWLSDLLWREEPMTLVADSHALLKQAGFLYTATYYWYEPRERPLPEPEQCVPCTIRPKVHTESILVYRKPGDMTPPSADILEASRISPEECRESQMTLWTPSPTLDHPYKRIVRSWSFAGELILNPFSGQGAVAVCAAQLGRRCATIELNPRFCAHIVSYLKDSVPDMEPR